MNDRQIDPRHGRTKEGLKTLGVLLMVVGGILTAIGLISFFSAFNGGGMPTMFWAAFVGIPLFSVGVKLAGFGFLGEISRYTSGEVSPVIKDSIDYVKDGQAVACAACGARNDPDAVFCDNCGTALKRKCVSCGTANDVDSKFCDNCGKALTADQPE